MNKNMVLFYLIFLINIKMDYKLFINLYILHYLRYKSRGQVLHTNYLKPSITDQEFNGPSGPINYSSFQNKFCKYFFNLKSYLAALKATKPLCISSLSGKLEIVSLRPQLFNKQATIQQNEYNAHKRYNSVNNRTITKYQYEYDNHLNSEFSRDEEIFPGTNARKNHSQIARMELNQSKMNPFNLKFKEEKEMSRRSVRKRIKIPQISGKKLPNCFSITNKPNSLNKKLNFDSDLNTTLDFTFRKVHSEQVSPRAIILRQNVMQNIAQSNQATKFFMSNISKQDWNDPSRFAPIINTYKLN